MKKIIKITENTLSKLVDNLLKEDHWDWAEKSMEDQDKRVSNIVKAEVRPDNVDDLKSLAKGTRWAIGPGYKLWRSTALRFTSDENPIMIYYNKNNHKQKVGCIKTSDAWGYQCYSSEDYNLPTIESIIDVFGLKDGDLDHLDFPKLKGMR